MLLFKVLGALGRDQRVLRAGPRGSWIDVATRLMGTAIVLMALLGVQDVPAVRADTITVCAEGCDHTSIQDALGASGDGAMVSVLDAVHTESGIVVDQNVTIAGGNAAGTVVQAHSSEGQASDRVFEIRPGAQVVIRDLTIRHGKVTGKPARGGGIWNGGTLTLEQVTIEANRAVGSPDGLAGMAEGGGIYNDGTLSLTGCTIAGNRAQGGNSSDYSGSGRGGGLFHAGDSATVVNTTISGNMTRPGSGSG